MVITKTVKKHIIIFSLAFFIFFLDRFIKGYVQTAFDLGKSVQIIPSFFSITYLHNTGAGFSLFQNMQLVLILISLLALFLIYYYFSDLPKKPYIHAAIGLILGGILSNLYDRVFLGYVVDYLDFHIWPIFNLADSALSVGIIFLIYYFWKEESAAKNK